MRCVLSSMFAVAAVLWPAFAPSSALASARASRVQDPQPLPAPPPADALQRSHQLAQPGERHALLQRLVGEWDVAVRTLRAGAEPVTGRGRMQGKALLGGRYVQLDFTYELGGAAVAASQVLGYDALRERFTSSWRDTLTTWALECEGAPSPSWRDGMALTGRIVEPTDGSAQPCRIEIDLGDFERITCRQLVGEGAAARAIQTQDWTRR